jgi:prepilin-type N-terminal cleavage/methylation domain-containing protein
MRNDKGFTLVELIVVVVMIGIMTGLGAIGYTQFFQLSSSSNLETLSTAFDSARYKTMASSDGKVTLEIYNNGKSYIATVKIDGAEDEEYKVGSSKYILSLNVDHISHEIYDNSTMIITFKKSDGSFDTCSIDGTSISWGSSNIIYSSSSDYKMILAKETGRVLVE